MNGTLTLATNDEILARLYAEIGLTLDGLPGSVTIEGADPITPSVHRFGDACAVALAAMGAEVSALWHERSGRAQDVHVSVHEATRQLMAVLMTTVSGVRTFLLGDQTLIRHSAFYSCAGGRVIDIAVACPHLHHHLCEVLDCAPVFERIATAVSRWDAFELEAALATRGVAAAVVRTAGEWAEHPVKHGGSYRIHIALARVSMWAASLGMLPREQVAGIPMIDPFDGDRAFATVDGPYGQTRYLTTRIDYSDIEPVLHRGAEPLGASPLAWTGQTEPSA